MLKNLKLSLKGSLNYLKVILSHHKTNSNSFFSNRNKSQDFKRRQTDTDYSKSTEKHFFVSCYPSRKIGNSYDDTKIKFELT